MSKDRKKLLHIHSSVNDKQPTPATLELGELGVNNAKGNAFISTKNSDGEVVRFSEDDTIVNWMEMKEVFPYEGYVRGSESGTSGVTEADLLNNKSNIIVKLNQVVPKGTDYDPYDKQVNGATDIYGNPVNPINADGTKDGAGFAIDMSRYAMIDANPSFSSITTTCHATLSGTTEVKGSDDGCGSYFGVDVKNACIDASETLNEYGVEHSNFGTSCDGSKISMDTTLKGEKILIDSPIGDETIDIRACNHISGVTNNFVIEQCDNGQATIEMNDVCLVGNNKINVYGDETNIGLDCDCSGETGTIATDTRVFGKGTLITTYDKCRQNASSGEVKTTAIGITEVAENEINESATTINEKANVICDQAEDKATFYGAVNTVVGVNCDDTATAETTTVRGNDVIVDAVTRNLGLTAKQDILESAENDIYITADKRVCTSAGVSVALVGMEKTNIGTSCEGNTTELLSERGTDITIFADDHLCESGNVVSVFAGGSSPKLYIGGNDCKGGGNPSGYTEIVYYRKPQYEKCGISADTVDGALTEVLDRRKLDITSSITDGNTAYTFTQDSENGDCGLNKTIVIPKPETPLSPCNAPLHLQVNGESVETYYPCEENTFNVEIPTCDAKLTLTVNDEPVGEYAPCGNDKSFNIRIPRGCEEPLTVKYGGNVCASGTTTYNPCSAATITIPSKSSDFYYNGLQILAKRNQKSGQYIQLTPYYPAVPEESGCTSGKTEIKFDTPSITFLYGKPCGNDSPAYTPFGGLFDSDGVPYSAGTYDEDGKNFSARTSPNTVVIPSHLKHLPHSTLEIDFNKTDVNGNSVSAETVLYDPAHANGCEDSGTTKDINFGHLVFQKNGEFYEHFDVFSNQIVDLKDLKFKSSGETLATYNPFSGLEREIYPLKIKFLDCSGNTSDTVDYNPFKNDGEFLVSVGNCGGGSGGDCNFSLSYTYGSPCAANASNGSVNCTSGAKSIYIPKTINDVPYKVLNIVDCQGVTHTYNPGSGVTDCNSVGGANSAITITLPSCGGDSCGLDVDVKYGNPCSNNASDFDLDCSASNKTIWIPKTLEDLPHNVLTVNYVSGDTNHPMATYNYDPSKRTSCANSAQTENIKSYDLKIVATKCGEAYSSITYNPFSSEQTLNIELGDCGGEPAGCNLRKIHVIHSYFKSEEGKWTTACEHYKACNSANTKDYDPCDKQSYVVNDGCATNNKQPSDTWDLYIPTNIADISNNLITTSNISAGPTKGYCDDGCVIINTGLCVSGSVVAESFFSSSDRRLKENISVLDKEDIKKVNDIEFKSFNFKDDESKTKTYGVIAQDVQKAGLDNIVHSSDNGMLNVDYTSLLLLKIASMEETIKDLNIKIDLLTNRLNFGK